MLWIRQGLCLCLLPSLGVLYLDLNESAIPLPSSTRMFFFPPSVPPLSSINPPKTGGSYLSAEAAISLCSLDVFVCVEWGGTGLLRDSPLHSFNKVCRLMV